MPVEKGQQLGVEVLLGQDMVKQVGPVEGGPDQPRIAQAEPGEDVLFHGGGGGRRERRDRTVREPLHKAGQGQIVRAEVVSPLRNAVGFVDGEKRDGTRGEGFQKPGTPNRSGDTYRRSSSPVRSEADTAARSAALSELLNAAARRPLAQAAST